MQQLVCGVVRGVARLVIYCSISDQPIEGVHFAVFRYFSCRCCYGLAAVSPHSFFLSSSGLLLPPCLVIDFM